MKRIIIDFKKLTPEILNLLVEKFPDGYGIRDVIHFTNHKGQYIEAVEVKTEDTVYMVRISDQLADSMESFDVAVPEEDNIDVKDVNLNDDD